MATLFLRPDDDRDPERPQVQRSWISREELLTRLREAQADSALRDELGRLAGQTTDDLGSIR
jgi:hypothetical protein